MLQNTKLIEIYERTKAWEFTRVELPKPSSGAVEIHNTLEESNANDLQTSANFKTLYANV